MSGPCAIPTGGKEKPSQRKQLGTRPPGEIYFSPLTPAALANAFSLSWERGWGKVARQNPPGPSPVSDPGPNRWDLGTPQGSAYMDPETRSAYQGSCWVARFPAPWFKMAPLPMMGLR